MVVYMKPTTVAKLGVTSETCRWASFIASNQITTNLFITSVAERKTTTHCARLQEPQSFMVWRIGCINEGNTPIIICVCREDPQDKRGNNQTSLTWVSSRIEGWRSLTLIIRFRFERISEWPSDSAALRSVCKKRDREKSRKIVPEHYILPVSIWCDSIQASW